MIRLIAFIACSALVHADSLEEILKRMDASAKTFQSVSAKIKQITYTEVIKDSTEGMGEMRLKKTNKGLVGIIDFSPPDTRTYHIANGKVEIYYPKNNVVEVYDLSKYRKSLDAALLLGFGTSGSELQKDYSIKMDGAETVQSTPTTHLELTPKPAEIQKLVSRVDLWIQNGKSYPVQAKSVQPSKDYSMFIYSDIKINPQVSDSAYKLTLPPNVRRVEPQK